MTPAGLRESNDIDLLISASLRSQLIDRGWTVHEGRDGDEPIAHDVFDAHTNWRIGSYDRSLEDLLKEATVIDGIAFAALKEVRNWKAALGRPKDLMDIELIDRSGLLA